VLSSLSLGLLSPLAILALKARCGIHFNALKVNPVIEATVQALMVKFPKEPV